MQEINKNIYHEARYGRRALIIFSSVLLTISVAILGCGIALLVLGCNSNETTQIVWKVSIGVVLILLSLTTGSISIVMLVTAINMIKTDNGNVKDGNRAIGTVNILKCDKCGRELKDDSAFCEFCGKEVDGKKKCECGAVNDEEAEFCTSCGKKLK